MTTAVMNFLRGLFLCLAAIVALGVTSALGLIYLIALAGQRREA